MERRPTRRRSSVVECSSRDRLAIPLTFTLALAFAVAVAVAVVDAQSLPHKSERPPQKLYLLWNDSYDLFPLFALTELSQQITELFAEHELDVQLLVAEKGRTMASYPKPSVNAVLSPGTAPSRFPDNVMAAAVGEHDKGYTIFVFLPTLLENVAIPSSGWTPRHVADLTRAIGRVLAHELIHVLAPERGHSDSGLMAEQLSRRTLLGETIDLDRESRVWARAGFVKWVDAVRPEPARRLVGSARATASAGSDAAVAAGPGFAIPKI